MRAARMTRSGARRARNAFAVPAEISNGRIR
jgi:hypothetical protein